MAVDWERIKTNRFAKETPPKGYWDGKEIVVRDAVRLEWPERLFTFLIAVGTFGYFILEVGKMLKWWGG